MVESGRVRADRDAIFIDSYMIDFNATRAARETLQAGSNASQIGYNMLRKQAVRDEIDRRLAARRAENKLTVAHIEGMLRDIADVEPLDIWDADGNVRPLQEMPPHARKAIKSIKKTTREHYVTGEEETITVVELWDKKGAIELLGKHKKMFTDKIELDGKLSGKVSFTINGVAK
jgi:phage terminase small subunit